MGFYSNGLVANYRVAERCSTPITKSSYSRCAKQDEMAERAGRLGMKVSLKMWFSDI